MNSYLIYIDAFGMMLTPLYALMFSLILFFFLRRYRFSQIEAVSFIFIFFYFYFCFLVNVLFNIAPIYPDTHLFSKIIEDGLFPENQSLGVRLYAVFVYPLRHLFVNQVETFLIFQIFVLVVSAMTLWRAWTLLLERQPKNGEVVTYIILVCCYPGFLLFTLIPLREYIVLYGLSLFVAGYINVRKAVKKGLWYMAIATALLCVARPVLIILPFLSLFLLSRRVFLKVVLGISSIVLVPVIFNVLTPYSFTPEFLAYLRNSANDRYAASDMVYGVVDWNSYLDVVYDMPSLLLQFLLSPWPIIHDINYWSMKAHFIDSIYCFIVYMLALLVCKKSKDFGLLFFLIATVFSIWEFYIGGAVRHRMPLVAILLPAASYCVYILCKRVTMTTKNQQG